MPHSPPVLLARQLYEEAIALLAEEQGVHPETACSLFGLMIGTALLRKHHPDLAESATAGKAFPSDLVEQDAPFIVAAFEKLAQEGGLALDVRAAFEALPPEHEPIHPPLELLKMHGGRLWALAAAAPLSPEDRLLATLFAAVFLMRQILPALKPSVQSTLFMQGFLVGAKSVPPRAPELDS